MSPTQTLILKLFFLVAYFLLFCIFGFISIYQYIEFNRNCGGYLRRAASSNNIERASQELQKAIDYIEENNLTKGSTHVIYSSPECDLEFWYENLRDALRDLHNFHQYEDATAVSNQLMKLHETIIFSNQNGGESLNIPPNIYIYPFHKIVFWVKCILVVLVIPAGLIFFSVADRWNIL